MLSIMAWTREYLRSLLNDESVSLYIGKIDNAKENAIGIYSDMPGFNVKAVGLKGSYDIAGVRLLVHGTKNAKVTEGFARTVYNALDNANNFTWGNDTAGYADIFYIALTYAEPNFIGTDENGVYEYHISATIYYKETDKTTGGK